MTAPHLFFEIAGHAAALPLAQVAGVHEPSPVFPLAGFSPALKGLATVGGRVLAVLDPIALVPEEDDNPVDRQPRKTTSPTQVFLILDGPAQGVALCLVLPVRLGTAGQAASLSGDAPLARYCRSACLDPCGRRVPVLDTEHLLGAALRGPAP